MRDHKATHSGRWAKGEEVDCSYGALRQFMTPPSPAIGGMAASDRGQPSCAANEHIIVLFSQRGKTEKLCRERRYARLRRGKRRTGC
jgi:hypothetical protein